MNSKKLPTLDELLSIEIPENVSVDNLREALVQINKHEVDKNVPIDDIIRYVSSLGIPSETPAKYLGIILLNWIEKLTIEHETEEGLAGNTGGDLEDKLEKYEDRLKQKKEIQDDSKRIIDAALKKKQSIQDELNKTRAAESELKGKRLYVSVKLEDQIKIDKDEEAIVEKLRRDTVENDKRTAEIDKLSKEFEQHFSIKNEKEREIVARSAVVGIIAQVHNPNLDHKINAEILKTVADSSSLSALIGGSDILELTRQGSIALSLNENAQQAISRQAAVFLYGDNVSTYLFGPETIEVEVSNTPQSDTSHVVDLSRLNINHQVLLEKQLQTLDELSQSENPTTTIYTNIISNTKSDESKIDTSKAKKLSEVEKISELVKRTTPKKIGGTTIFESIEVNPWVTDVLPQTNHIGVLAEKTTGQGLGSTAVLILTQQIGSKAAGTVAAKGVLAKILPKLFGAGGPLAWLGAEAVSWVVQWLTKNQEKIPYILAGIAGVGTLPFLGLGTALLVAGTSFAIVGGVSASSMLVTSLLGGLNLFWRLVVLPPLKGFFFGFLAIIISTAFILLIINSGAYVVPPSPYSSQNGGADNPYMLVTKTANPTKLDNSDSNQTVIYIVTVKALKGNLTNVNITGSECNVIKKDKSTVECPREVFPEITNESISPNEPHSFSFTGIYDSKYSDSLIYDSITFTATAEDGTEVTTSGSASVCIGECPANCAVISDNADTWPSSIRPKAEAGLGILSQYQGFTAKACPRNETINLCYKPSEIDPDLYAWHIHDRYKDGCDVYFNDGPFKSNRNELDAAFIITHELTHHIQRINASHFVGYLASGSAWELKGNGLCTYSATIGVSVEAQQEAMAEAAALQVNSSPSWDTCATNYQGLYPKNFTWSEGFMTK